TGNGHSLENSVWISFEHAPVHERSRISFIGIADDIFLFAFRLVNDSPFQPRRISRSTPAAQSALPDLLDKFNRLELGEDFCKGIVTADSNILFDAFSIDLTAVLQDNLLLRSKKRSGSIDEVLFDFCSVENMFFYNFLRRPFVDTLIQTFVGLEFYKRTFTA